MSEIEKGWSVVLPRLKLRLRLRLRLRPTLRILSMNLTDRHARPVHKREGSLRTCRFRNRSRA
jgi:hypothetical protein